jgi:hypothetical protein
VYKLPLALLVHAGMFLIMGYSIWHAESTLAFTVVSDDVLLRANFNQDICLRQILAV